MNKRLTGPASTSLSSSTNVPPWTYLRPLIFALALVLAWTITLPMTAFAQEKIYTPLQYNGHVYLIIDESLRSFDEAEKYCERLDGHLATLTSAEENAAVYEYKVSQGVDSAYFGYTDEGTPDHWRWITGEVSSYVNWYEGEPNGDDEHYGMFYYSQPGGGWNDGDWGDDPFICEWDSAQALNAHKVDPATIPRYWDGEYTGSYDDVDVIRGYQINITDVHADGSIEGTAVFFPSDKADAIYGENGTYHFTGMLNTLTGSISLKGDSWIHEPNSNWSFIYLSGVMDVRAGTITGTSENGYWKMSALNTSGDRGEQIPLSYMEFPDGNEYIYRGSPVKIAVNVTAMNGKILTEGIDYTLTFQDNTSGGTASVTATGKGSYSGTITSPFTIIEPSEVSLMADEIKVVLSPTSFTYTGKACKPTVTITYGTTKLKLGTDYELEYHENVEVGLANVAIFGRGKYAGSMQKSYQIKAAKNLGKLDVVFHVNTSDKSAKISKVTKKQAKVTIGSVYGKLPTAVRKGYTFTGWSTKKKKGTIVKAASVVKKTGTISAAKSKDTKGTQHLYAQWEKKKVTISLNANGGSLSTKTVTRKYGEKYGSLPEPKRNGYRFAGWYTGTGKNAKKVKSGTKATKNVKFYAHWKKEVTFTFYSGITSKSGLEVKQTVTEGSKIIISGGTPKRDGYIFQGWNDKPGSDQVTVRNGDTLKSVKANRDLYAVWQKVQTTAGKMVSVQGLKDASAKLVYTAEFAQNFFKADNTKENRKLARLSALAAATTYKGGQTETFLKDCGFDDVVKKFSKKGADDGSSSKNDNDHATMYMGWQRMDDGTNLIALVINGYSKGGCEWISNFNLGTGSNHEGFNLAANEIMVKAKAYISEHKGAKGTRLWICGHSRGAALTNLIAIKMTDQGVIPANKIYAYGFATPQYTTGMKGSYSMIFNYISPHDFVPCVAPSRKGWGYQRMGHSITFNNKKLSQFKKKYQEYTGKNYGGFTVLERKIIVDAFCALGKSKAQYSKRTLRYNAKLGVGNFSYFAAKDYAMKGIGYVMSKGLEAKGAATMLAYSAIEDSAAKLTALLLVDGKVTTKINDAHIMASYLAWLDM